MKIKPIQTFNSKGRELIGDRFILGVELCRYRGEFNLGAWIKFDWIGWPELRLRLKFWQWHLEVYAIGKTKHYE